MKIIILYSQYHGNKFLVNILLIEICLVFVENKERVSIYDVSFVVIKCCVGVYSTRSAVGLLQDAFSNSTAAPNKHMNNKLFAISHGL